MRKSETEDPIVVSCLGNFNLFRIRLTKEVKVYHYPYKFEPEIPVENQELRDILFRRAFHDLKRIFGECFISGDKLYALTKITEPTIFRSNQIPEYTIYFKPYSNESIFREGYIREDKIYKQCIELMLRDILHANPNLSFYRNLIISREGKPINGANFILYPGFTTSYMKTMNGSFLNVTLKNRIVSTQTILEIIDEMRREGYSNIDIKNYFIEKSFKTSYSNRNYIIEDISFDKNPTNTEVNREGHTMNLINYYREAHDLQIQNRHQPLILVNRKGPQEQVITLYFIPEFCHLCGLDESTTQNFRIMNQIAAETKIVPNKRVERTGEFIELLNNNNRRVRISNNGPNRELLSAREKRLAYGFNVEPIELNTRGHYMAETHFVGGDGEILLNKPVFPIIRGITLKKWLCLYYKRNYDDAAKLLEFLQKASKGYHITIEEPEWVEMNSNYPQDWIEIVDEYLQESQESQYQFVLFLIYKDDSMYATLKRHSLTQRGYNSQVVKVFSLKKNIMSVCSKILLQINAKLGGTSYTVQFGQNVQDKHLMIVGVDSSHIRGKRTGVAMVASMDSDFTDFYNKEAIIIEQNKCRLQFCVSEFLEEAIQKFFKINNFLPGGIVIYRQGVSFEQKKYLENEVLAIQEFLEGKGNSYLKGKSIPYYYILVNTKATYKFFEFSQRKDEINYTNPSPGLLVYDGVTNPDFFEFYIQPQKVTGGSATPTCYHVAYGNLNSPDFLPKFTYDLCHLYSNWQGPVRIPNVLKNAEKLSKMTSKFTMDELHNNLAFGQSYL